MAPLVPDRLYDTIEAPSARGPSADEGTNGGRDMATHEARGAGSVRVRVW